jgi:hypothetical protein
MKSNESTSNAFFTSNTSAQSTIPHEIISTIDDKDKMNKKVIVYFIIFWELKDQTLLSSCNCC